MSQLIGQTWRLLAGVSAAALLTIGLTAQPAHAQAIQICVSGGGIVKGIDTHCGANEVGLLWNISGPTGPSGPVGDAGVVNLEASIAVPLPAGCLSNLTVQVPVLPADPGSYQFTLCLNHTCLPGDSTFFCTITSSSSTPSCNIPGPIGLGEGETMAIAATAGGFVGPEEGTAVSFSANYQIGPGCGI